MESAPAAESAVSPPQAPDASAQNDYAARDFAQQPITSEELQLGLSAPLDTPEELADVVDETINSMTAITTNDDEADTATSMTATQAIDDIIGDVMGDNDSGRRRDYFNTDVNLDDD